MIAIEAPRCKLLSLGVRYKHWKVGIVVLDGHFSKCQNSVLPETYRLVHACRKSAQFIINHFPARLRLEIEVNDIAQFLVVIVHATHDDDL